MYVVDRWHQFRESVQEKNVKEFDFCSNPLPRLSTKMREVEELLSRKAFEKLATHQDLSNAIEKVFFRSEFLKKKVVFLLVQYLLLLASWKRRFYIPYHPQLLHHYLGTLYIPITISTSRKQYIVVGLLSKKDVRDDDVARCTEQQDCSMKLQVNVGGHLESAFSIAIQQSSGSLLMHSGAK